MRKLKFILSPFLVLHIICYVYSGKAEYIDADVKKFLEAYRINIFPSHKNVVNLIFVLLNCSEFRNIFYVRILSISTKLHIRFILTLILPDYKFLSIATPADSIGKGLYIEHGNSTIIRAQNIGDNCWINQNVTIGDNGKGIPSIGNNVRIGTGAVVIGPIKIGNFVIIGANATVVKDVPDYCTVVPSPSYIIKRNSKIVYEKL